MNSKSTVLVVDDEPQILRVLNTNLPPQGYNVKVATNGQEALKVMESHALDLIILDLIMPEMSGLDVCKEIRKTSNVPIIILSAKELEHDKISALDLGADDYITKPFSMNELLARMRAVLRRFSISEIESPILHIGDITINVSSWEVLVNRKPVNLTPKEFEILKYLMNNAGKVVTIQNLIESIWGVEFSGQGGHVRVCINHLRNKIEPDPENPRYILSVPWVGYKFAINNKN